MQYGTQYYRPPFPSSSCFKRDMENMQKLGFNHIKLWAVWNWIERTPGKFDYQELDLLVDMAKEHGLAVVINTIPEGAPYWTNTGDPDDLYKTADGQAVEYGGPANLPSGGWPGLCMDNSQFAALVARFIEETANHFKDEPAVLAIDVWNEPHLEPMYDYRSNMLCYCKHSKAAFIRWLKDKYKTIERLNKAWYRTYQSFEQVSPPVRFGTWADMLDWRRFWLENLQKWLKIRVEACKRGAPNLKVQTHVAYSGILGNRTIGGLANELGDEFLLAKEVDIFGLSSFPKWLMGKEHIYRHFIHNEMIAESSHGKPFYQVELQGGAGKSGLLGGEVPDARDITLWNWNTVAAGGKGSVYWQYAPEPAGIESPGFGLTGFQGENTIRSMVAGKMAKLLNQKPLLDAAVVSALNAVYVSRSSDLICFASERREEMYAGSLSGIFRAAYDKGIPVRFFHEDYIDELLGSGIQVLFLPMPLVMTPKEISIFYEFVKQGGTLVTEAGLGLYQQDGLLDLEGNALRKLFGISHKEIQGIEDWGEVRAWKNDGSHVFTGRFYKQLICPQNEISVIARFEDGEPAITEYGYGKGKAVWIGSYAGYYYEKTGEENTGNVISNYMRTEGYSFIDFIEISTFSKQQIPLAPVIRMLETSEEYILVAVNHTFETIRIKIRFNEDFIINYTGYDGRILELELKESEGVYIYFHKQ